MAEAKSQLPKDATDFIRAKTGVNLAERDAPPMLHNVRMMQQKRQDNVQVNGDCSQGKAQCCDTTMSGADANSLSALLGVDNLAGQIGINCVNLPINVIGVSGSLSNICKSTPVCCQNVTQNGLVNLGCSALPIN